MKQKGFEKPVKYLFIGEPNLTKTTLAGRTGLTVFETDSLSDPNDISHYDLSKDIIIFGGKHGIVNYPYGEIVKRLAKYQVIILHFMKGN